MQGSRKRVIEEEQVTLVDLTLETSDDRLACLSGTREVVQKSDPTEEQSAVSHIEGDHQIMALIGDGASRDVLEGDDRLFDYPIEAVPDDRESHRVHVTTPSAEFDDHIAELIDTRALGLLNDDGRDRCVDDRRTNDHVPTLQPFEVINV